MKQQLNQNLPILPSILIVQLRAKMQQERVGSKNSHTSYKIRTILYGAGEFLLPIYL